MDRYLIAPLNVGLENDIKPWLLPDDGYEQLNEAYIFRGWIRKRFGSRYMVPESPSGPGYEQYASRLRVSIGVTPGPINIPDSLLTTQLAIGQSFTVGDNAFYIWQLGAGVTTLSTNPAITATINSVANPNTVTFAGAPAGVNIFWYPSRPAMGLPLWQTSTLNNEPTIAFDTQYAYKFTATGWERLNLELEPNAAHWTGSNSQLFSAYTYQGVELSQNFLFVTNFNELEPNFMRYMDSGEIWHNFSPKTLTAVGNNIVAGRIIIGFHDHLVILNTWETVGGAPAVNFKNRARYCAIGSPIDNALAVPLYYPWIDNKNDVNFRGGGYVDNLETQEQIVSAEFLKDRLIVGYSRSKWELVYTGNQQIPFVWQKINDAYGSQSTFSPISLEDVTYDVAQNAYTACTGANVARIDDKIPDDVFNIRTINQGPQRVYGIRDFKTEVVYWSIPYAPTTGVSTNPASPSDIFPNQVVVYNYKNGSWAYNTDSFTCFGYFTRQPAVTWGTITQLWQNMTQNWGDGSLQQGFQEILAGNQEGFIVIVDPNLTRNAGALQITNATALNDVVTLTIINHNLTDTNIFTTGDEFVLLENIKGDAQWQLLNGVITPILEIVDRDTIKVASFPFVGANAYTGGGTVARVSNINILSKQWNPYAPKGSNVFIQKMDFLVGRSGDVDALGVPFGGEVTVDYYPSTSKYSMLSGSVPGQLQCSGTLETRPYNPTYYPFEKFQDRLWHVMYYAVDGNAIQIRIYMSDLQMINPNISLVDFQLHAVLLHTMPTSSRIGG